MSGSWTGLGGLTHWPAVLSQYLQGGPIIAVQVENEYGFFYKDEAYMPYLLQVSRLPPSGRAPTLRAAGPRLSVPVNPPAVRAAREAGAALAWGECAASSLPSQASCRSREGRGKRGGGSAGSWASDRAAAACDVGTLSSAVFAVSGASQVGGHPWSWCSSLGETLGPQPTGSNQGVSVKRGSHVSCSLRAGAVGGPCSRCHPRPPTSVSFSKILIPRSVDCACRLTVGPRLAW